MVDINYKLGILYPYSYEAVEKILKKSKNVSISSIITHDSIIASPSIVRQILNYSSWAEKSNQFSYRYRRTGEAVYKKEPIEYRNMVRCAADAYALSDMFSWVSITYELLVNSSINIDIRDIGEACGVNDLNILRNLMGQLSWVDVIDRRTVSYIPAECDLSLSETQVLRPLSIEENFYFNDAIDAINSDLSLNIYYPHLYPRLKDTLEAMMEVERNIDFDTIFRFLRDEYYMERIPRASAVEIILDKASWSVQDRNRKYSFDDSLVNYDVNEIDESHFFDDIWLE